jgi:hypothetical protein
VLVAAHGGVDAFIGVGEGSKVEAWTPADFEVVGGEFVIAGGLLATGWELFGRVRTLLLRYVHVVCLSLLAELLDALDVDGFPFIFILCPVASVVNASISSMLFGQLRYHVVGWHLEILRLRNESQMKRIKVRNI